MFTRRVHALRALLAILLLGVLAVLYAALASGEPGANDSVVVTRADTGSDAAVASHVSDTDASFVITGAEFSTDDLTIRVVPRIERTEIVAEPKLVASDTEWTAKILPSADGEIPLVFTGATRDAIGADSVRLVFPAVSVPLEVHRESPMTEAIDGPFGDAFTVVGREMDVNTGTVSLRYVPVEPSSNSVSLARIEVGEVTIDAVAVNTAYDSSTLHLKEGFVTFPITAITVLDDDSAVLVISEFREMVQIVQEIDLND